jgi:hypothetical protein
MQIRISNFAKLAALVAVVTLCSAAEARADQRAAATDGAPRAVAVAETATPGHGAREIAASVSSTATQTGRTTASSTQAVEPGASTTSGSAGVNDSPGAGPPTSVHDEGAPREAGAEASVLPPLQGAAVNQPVEPTSSPSPVPQVSGASIAEAVKEAIHQATTREAARPSDGQQATLAAAANATSQLVWQVQISECTAHCVAGKQSQSAEQRNTTLQVLTGATPAAGDPTAAQRSQGETRVTQIQLGCIAHCFGTTTATPSAQIERYAQVLEETLRQIAAGLPDLSSPVAADLNAVAESSYQYQSQSGESHGPSGAGNVQTQAVSQSNNTVQAAEASSSLIAALEAALGIPPASTQGALNETEQGIWQLQVGCLVDCRETELYQQASQSNATVQKLLPAADSASAASASLADSATQVTWQAQIGCLFWCFDATERQTASTVSTIVVIGGGGRSEPPATEAGPALTGAATAAPSSASAPSSSTSGDSPRALAGTDIAPAPPLAHVITAGKQRVGAARASKPAARTIASAPVRTEVASAAEQGAITPSTSPRPVAALAPSLEGDATLATTEASSLPLAVLVAAIALCTFSILTLALVYLRARSYARPQQ